MKKKSSLQKTILWPLLLLMLVEGVLLYTIFFVSGTLSDLRSNSFLNFRNTLESRENLLESRMVNRWGNLLGNVNAMELQMERMWASDGTSALENLQNKEIKKEVLSRMAEELVILLRQNEVTGAFVVLEGEEDGKNDGFYLKDGTPGTFTDDNADLLVFRGSAQIASEMEIALSKNWQPKFSFAEQSSSDFYNKPFEAALNHPDFQTENLGYWCAPFYMSMGRESESEQIITYTLPLRCVGEVVGVMGIELTRGYLEEILPASELNEENLASYVLMKRDRGTKEDAAYQVLLNSGTVRQGELRSEVILEQSDELKKEEFYRLKTQKSGKYFVCIKSLKLYNAYAPFVDEEWVLAAVICEENLLGFYQKFNRLFLFSILSNVILGMIVAVFVAKAVSKPIAELTRKLEKVQPMQKIPLKSVQIYEIDKLIQTIQNLNEEVLENASKLETILKMADVKIGVCEYLQNKKQTSFCTDEFCHILGISWNPSEQGPVPLAILLKTIQGLRPGMQKEGGDPGIYTVCLQNGEGVRWIKLQVVLKENRVLAVATDITKDMKEKQKIEYERDYDLLTNIYNRRAFQRKMQELFSNQKALRTAAMVMIDLDNLKYVNDTYGHDWGDIYIEKTADVLRNVPGNVVAARLSGDEFVCFLYGMEGKEVIREKMETLFRSFSTTNMQLPDGKHMPIRASAGIAWYPEDAKEYQELIKYADFAMYKVKKTDKGKQAEFNWEIYRKEAYLLQCQEELNQILEEELLDYAFQPIVDARDGSLYGYEALMRPKTKNIRTPAEILTLAHAQSKLQQIERVTLFQAMRQFVNKGLGRTKLCIFINSVSNQQLKADEFLEFERQFAPYLSQIVLEVTEEEQMDEKCMNEKRRYITAWGGKIALDDFGEGYSTEGALLKVNPNFLKIDRELIRNILKDGRKQELLRTILHYARVHGIYVVAEGIENGEELSYLIEQGVDYLQGYYLGKPSFQPSEISEEIQKEIQKNAKRFGRARDYS